MEVDVARLRELRRRRVLTLKELAEKAGVGRNTIWRLEHGVMGAQPRTIRKLAKALNVEPEELVKTGGTTMGKTKSRANGDGDVFPRKNKAGKITSYRGAYVGPDGKRRYVSGRTKRRRAGAKGGPCRTPTTGSSSTRTA